MTDDGQAAEDRRAGERYATHRGGEHRSGEHRVGEGPDGGRPGGQHRGEERHDEERDRAGDPSHNSGGSASHPSRPAFSRVRPHPTDDGVVGTYVHSYDRPRQQYQPQVPAMRPAQDPPAGYSSGYSATPIYDALYSEYLRSFRTLPGDRSGEENLGFTAFGTGMHGSSSGRQAPFSSTWQSGSHYSGGRAQAALPPAPRRGL
ncbi:hypothetical protein ACFXI8_19355 [Streptomyces niveus]|uniref:hypothetical protein n=1 Tax=Streptomyces niveus TaxID=193462 RepID=UPI003692CEA9